MKHRVYLYFVWLLLPVVTAVRTWELAAAIDSAGFYLERYATLCNVLEYVLLGLILLSLVFGKLVLAKEEKTPPSRSYLLSFAGIVLAFSAIVQASIDSTASGNYLHLIPGLLTAIGFAVMAAGWYQGRKPVFIGAVAPVIGELVRLVISYAHFNGIAQISENIVHILFMCSFLGFCLAHSRVYVGLGQAKGMGWLYGTAAATGVFGLAASLPHWIMGQNQSSLSVIGFGAALFAVAYLSVFILGRKQPEEQPDVVSNEEPS